MALPVTLAPDTVIAGKLRVVRLLGIGGMGAVYEVEHLFTKHRRAMKMLHAEMVTHKQIVGRFLREASAAGHIGDAHIVETFDAGTAESGAPYIVMEMLEGETLIDRIERNPKGLPLTEVVDLVRQACRGVHAAHAAGIVHRDLKPENLFLIQRDGKTFVKILDFGISKFDATLPGGFGTTKEGATLGTPFYMSPEQVNGEKDIDGRTDIYALGVILYECLTGHRPFDADALPKLAVLIHEGIYQPLEEVRADLPADFSAIVKRAMSKNRSERYATAQDLATALKPYGSTSVGPGANESESIWPRVVVATAGSSGDQKDEANVSGPTIAGSAISVDGANAFAEPKPRRSPFLIGGVAALMLSGAIVVGMLYSKTSGNDGDPKTNAALVQSVSTVATPPSASATSASSAAPLGSANEIDRAKKDAGNTVVSSIPTSTGTGTASPLFPQKNGGAKPTASSSGSETPTTAPPSASSRADQKGLAGDNPFNNK